jgi:benzodiazapine receptor
MLCPMSGLEKILGRTLQLLVPVLVCLGVGALGSLFSMDNNLHNWYATLNKPWFNPPNWVFAPVWTTLYILMGVAAFLVWQKRLGHRSVRIGLVLFVVQLALNGLWTPLFFGCHWIGTALIDIVLLWVAILAVIVAFHRVSLPAAICLYPYLAWVSFASVLNFRLWQLNP